jgi:hypothetical protein
VRHYPDIVKAPIRFDVAGLEQDLQRLEDACWVEHFVKQNYGGDWTVLPLRAPKGETHPIRQIHSEPGCTDFFDTENLTQSPSFQTVLAALPPGLLSVRLMALGAGSVIYPHSDHDVSLAHDVARLHVPIRTNDAVTFCLDGQSLKMQPGELWYLNFSKTHSVKNEGSTRRVHMVIDIQTSEALETLLGLQ